MHFFVNSSVLLSHLCQRRKERTVQACMSKHWRGDTTVWRTYFPAWLCKVSLLVGDMCPHSSKCLGNVNKYFAPVSSLDRPPVNCKFCSNSYHHTFLLSRRQDDVNFTESRRHPVFQGNGPVTERLAGNCLRENGWPCVDAPLRAGQ